MSSDNAVSASRTSTFLMGGVVLLGLYLAKHYNYLLFHTLAEIFSVVVACGIFVIAWNARRFMANNYFLLVGIASLCVGIIDLCHIMAFKGMGVFPDYGPDLATQLWIAARYLQSFALLVAPWFLGRTLKAGWTMIAFGAATALLLTAIFTGNFPTCFVEGAGLTPFKIGSEYLVCLLLLGARYFLHRKKAAFDQGVVRLLSSAIVAFIAAELAFTLYSDVYGISNMVGHFLKVAGFYFIYKALIETGLARPYDLLFRELKQSEERYRRLYKNTPVMLHSIDREGRLISVSNYWLEHLGYNRDETIGHKSTEFYSEESRRYTEEVALPAFFQSGFCTDIPLQLRKKNGEIIDVLLSATAERDAQGEITRSLSVMVDVTEQKRATERSEILNRNLEAKAAELEAANHELEAFSHTVSHDLRSPLTSISGSCQVLTTLCDDKLDDECKRFIGYIDDECRRMNTLITTLLRFSQMNRQELHRQEVDLSNLAAAIFTGLQMQDPERRVNCAIAAGVTCAADPLLICAVMENLLGNAWKYTGKKEVARIEFGVMEVEGKPAYFVRDNGAGFDMKEAHKLFDAFQRLHSRSEFEGTGIGLTTVQRIIQRHGGRVWAEGEEGRGATFFFTLSF